MSEGTRRPQEIVRDFAAAWNRGDADALAALFADDADFVNVVGLWWTRREQVRHNHAFGFARIFPGSTMTLDRVRVRRLGDDVAVVHAQWRVHGQTDPGGAPADDRRGVFSFVTERRPDGTWLAVSAQNTDIVPGAQTHLAREGELQPQRYDDPG